MKSIEIDIETYSSVSLQKCGVYKYAEVLILKFFFSDTAQTVLLLLQLILLAERIFRR